MSQIIIKNFSEKLNIKQDIASINGFDGVEKLKLLRSKYKTITNAFKQVIVDAPLSMKESIEAKDLDKFLIGLSEKFESDTINISVVAEVSSGKSTFLNALIFEKKVLDAKMGETTAKVFKISYGAKQNLDDLKKEISEINKNTKENIEDKDFTLENIKIEDYIIELKADNENLKNGIVLYDTPGFGTLNEKVMFKLIKEAVNRSDAVILLLDISKGLKKDESKFIENALAHIKENKRFIVLNKFDASIDENDDEDEIQEQINHVVKTTKNDLMKLNPNMDKQILDNQTYYLSALKALTGKSKQQKETLNFSRFPIFEDSFWNRIVEAKKETFNDNINGLIENASFITETAAKAKDSFSQIINQTNSIVENIEKVSSEIQEIIIKYSKSIENIKNNTTKSSLISQEASSFEKTLISEINSSIKQEINLISEADVTSEDFQKASENAMKIVNKKFQEEYIKFIEKISIDISDKEKNVNTIIDALNKDLKDEKFRKLNLEEIPKITKMISSNNIKLLKNQDNSDVHLNKDTKEVYTEIDTNFTHTNSISLSKDNLSSSLARAGLGTVAGATIGATAAGATTAGVGLATILGTAGSVIPGLGTVVGGTLGLILSSLNNREEQDRKHRKEMQKMQEEMMDNMQKMQESHQKEMQKIAEERYKEQIRNAKKDVTFEFTSNVKEEIRNLITELKIKLEDEYNTTLSEITSAIYNANNILINMQTIIEDPSEQKKIISENEDKIEEIELFIGKIERSFVS